VIHGALLASASSQTGDTSDVSEAWWIPLEAFVPELGSLVPAESLPSVLAPVDRSAIAEPGSASLVAVIASVGPARCTGRRRKCSYGE
jgi:hypothetical protein